VTMNRMYSWIRASRTEGSDGLVTPKRLSTSWNGKGHATERTRKLVQNGASATMKSAICTRRLCTFSARKYATGTPRTRHTATATADGSELGGMLLQWGELGKLWRSLAAADCVLKRALPPSFSAQKLTRMMRPSGASREKPSHRAPGSV